MKLDISSLVRADLGQRERAVYFLQMRKEWSGQTSRENELELIRAEREDVILLCGKYKWISNRWFWIFI